MKSPTTSVAVVFRQLTRARRERVMVTLHPDAVQWMLLLAAARKNCVLEPREAKTLVRLLGELQNDLESSIDSCLLPGQTKPRNRSLAASVARDRRMWKEAEELIAKLTGSPYPLKPNRYSGPEEKL
jgi:hypothetical protein